LIGRHLDQIPRYEVGYASRKTKPRAAVKKAVKKVGNSRKKVERRLGR
jgi:hypothetical protein